MKLDRWFLAIGTITAVLSCKSSTSGPAAQNIIHMPLKFDALEAWVKSIEIVPLDGDDTHLLGSRVEIDTDGKDWFIADKENGKLFRYSGEGRFLNEIGRRGNGPGEFLKLQGLDDEKLSLTDFIEGFIDSDNVANASVDANANIAQKDIVTLLSEMSKPHQKLLAFNKLRLYNLRFLIAFSEQFIFIPSLMFIIGLNDFIIFNSLISS